jgi:hypothetical protein
VGKKTGIHRTIVNKVLQGQKRGSAHEKIAPHCQAGALVADISAASAGSCHASSAVRSDSRRRRLIFQVLNCYAAFLGSEQTVLAALHNDILQEFEELSLTKSG